MKFTGDLFVQARTIKKAADIIQSLNAPNVAEQNHLLWFLGLVAIRGLSVLRYDGTVEEKLDGSVTDEAISALSLHGHIVPDHNAGIRDEPPIMAWKKATLSGEVGRVMKNPPPIPIEFPQLDQAASQDWLSKWDEVLHEIGQGDSDSQFKELLSNRGLRGNKLLAGMVKYSQEVGLEEAGVTRIVKQWDKSTIEERYLLSSGLINNAFRPFLLVSMANQSGSLALLEERAFRSFNRLEFSLVTKAAAAILKAQVAEVDVSEESLVDDEPDLILLAGLQVLKKADPRQGPHSLIEKALEIARENACLPQFFQSIVLKSADLRPQHPAELVQHLEQIKTDLKHSGLCAKIPATRKWLNTINRHVPDIAIDGGKSLGPASITYVLGQVLGQDPWVSISVAAAGGIFAKEVMDRLGRHLPKADKFDLDAAASAWSNLSNQWLNAEQVKRDFVKFWNAPRAGRS